MIIAKTAKLTESGQAYLGECVLLDILIGMDATNDPSVSVFDGTDSSGAEKLPTNTYDASKLGLNGVVWQFARKMDTGIYVLIDLAAGDVEVIVGHREWKDIVGRNLTTVI